VGARVNETPAEIRGFRHHGRRFCRHVDCLSDCARQMRIKVLAISCVTNMAAGFLTSPSIMKKFWRRGERSQISSKR